MKKLYTIIALFSISFLSAQIVINEIDADQSGSDTAEFIELYSSNPNTSLDGFILVFFNGSNDSSYNTIDLAGQSTDANGFFVLGNAGVANANVELPLNSLQNGQDALALYQDSAANFSNGTAPTTVNLIDAIVYDTSDSDDTVLLNGLGEQTQWDENMNGSGSSESLQLQSDNTYASLTPTPGATNNVVQAVTYQAVSDVSTLRSGVDGNYYELTGEAIVTYARSSRNQKYIQDSTGGILIDDSSGAITSSYVIGDGMTGLKGKLSEYSGVLQFIPQEDPGAASSTGNTIQSTTVTISDLTTNHEPYESEVVEIQNVTISEADGTATWSSGTNYTITDSANNSMTLRTSFYEADYVGELIPAGNIAFNCLVAEYNGTPQVIPLPSQNQLLSIIDFNGVDVAVYPNPVQTKLNFLGLSSPVQATVFDMLGKRQLQSEVTNSLDVSQLKSGLYMVEIKNENSAKVFNIIKK